MIIVGRHPVLEAIKAGKNIEKVILQFGVKGPVIDEIRRLARQRGIRVTEADRNRFRGLSSSSSAQGVAAMMAETEYVETDEILNVARSRGEVPFILVLDGIEDPHNLGALIRTADAAGVHGVVLPKHLGAPLSETAVKSSAGAALHLSIAKVANLSTALNELKRQGLWIVGTDERAEKTYVEADFKGPVALVVGSEGKGIRRLVKEQCDILVRIPMYGKVASLNASVAGALVIFEVARSRRDSRS
jgi:23S rRNA (guanosine2251-2'-O)-methyltransferase